MATSITIQQAATATGLSIHTLRYYEKIGLIDPVPRQSNQHRLYRQEDLRWIEFLLRLRATGMSIQQMLRYAELRRLGEQLGSVSERKVLLEQHTEALQAELLELQDTLEMLRGKVAFYASLEQKLKVSDYT
ncbi:MerR family transcriptional regulator [Collimonas sp.]|jgi:DNA-binding transcriptional MerR regulator|uniref:MerR family transcriptional regulator n=1 Tax=Collimonas sp. TaxID=1963772 RepID=UPI002BC90804|nr:MerR family transcriptional regulator [Collimonas sp.]HWW03649.1 MerR family transcriptional regulator [Collimonas sp.]